MAYGVRGGARIESATGSTRRRLRSSFSEPATAETSTAPLTGRDRTPKYRLRTLPEVPVFRPELLIF